MKEKYYLGLSLGFNSSACVVSNKRGLISAISQERLNGKKNTKELPFEAAIECVRLAGIHTIEQIAISHYEEMSNEYFEKYQSHNHITCLGRVTDWKKSILNVLSHNDIYVVNKNIVRIDHHTAHGLSTFGFYGMPSGDHYVITSDGFGDGYSAKIKYNDEIISELGVGESVALVYQFVTGALGFKMHQHEGKITGLAAFGEPKYVGEINKVYFDHECNIDECEINKNIIDFDEFLMLKKSVFELVENLKNNGATREDIAASVQEFAEVQTINWIKANCKHGGIPCYLAGGLFANVKINQRIKDMGLFSQVYVCPAMGDEGTCVGAALAISQYDGFRGTNPQECGTIVGEDPIEVSDMIPNQYKYDITVTNNTAKEIASRLADNKIVCIKREAMEFGPRALCHTSILYNCDSKESNDWLNKKLSRSEFMPFAPVCRFENARSLFKNIDAGINSAKFMTMTFDGTDEFIENYPAVCHIDNTARPQLVTREDDPLMWRILDLYEKKTNKKCLVNTSFNLHEYPIIESIETAIDSWEKSGTDTLVIGECIIDRK